MSKKIENLLCQLCAEIVELKKVVEAQSEEIAALKGQLNCASMVKIEENGIVRDETFGNLILDEIVSIKTKLEIITRKEFSDNINEQGDNEFSLNELKKELIRLADMMNT
ncbi:MAG: hypothetical protein IKC35_02655 [Clostridia bacterium]|nr:hypothetical protein [Clostridia bacterium]